MKSIILVLLIASSTLAASDIDTVSFLRRYTDAIDVKEYRIEICPTNSCERFEAAEHGKQDVLADYALLYAIHKGRYADFAARADGGVYPEMQFIEDARRLGYGEKILEKHAASCECVEQSDQVDCVLKALAKQARLRRSSVTYDEGKEIVEEIN